VLTHGLQADQPVDDDAEDDGHGELEERLGSDLGHEVCALHNFQGIQGAGRKGRRWVS
jgi:hypothetical protein